MVLFGLFKKKGYVFRLRTFKCINFENWILKKNQNLKLSWFQNPNGFIEKIIYFIHLNSKFQLLMKLYV